jgi:rhodanese-related sulfurtransferase
LIEEGYGNVYALDGGWDAWVGAGYSTEPMAVISAAAD